MVRKILPFLLTVCLPLTAACDRVEQAAGHVLKGTPPTVTVALFDRSSSVPAEDRAIYLASMRALGKGLHGGDRLLFAAIGDQTRSTFHPALDVKVKQTDVRLDQEDAERAAEATVSKQADALLSGAGGAAASRILEAATAATEAFPSNGTAKRRMILLTDGVENSEVVNLAAVRITPEEIRTAIERARAAGLLPDLTGVELSVIGAGGADFRGVESFWRAFAAATHASLVHYGRLPYEAPAQTS